MQIAGVGEQSFEYEGASTPDPRFQPAEQPREELIRGRAGREDRHSERSTNKHAERVLKTKQRSREESFDTDGAA